MEKYDFKLALNRMTERHLKINAAKTADGKEVQFVINTENEISPAVLKAKSVKAKEAEA